MMVDEREAWGALLAAVNATLNGTSAMLLAAGFWAIKSGRRTLHGWLMGSAFAVSTVFLVCYLIRVYLTGAHRYPGGGALRIVYFGLLGSHMLLAAATPPLAIRAIYLALRRRFADHKRIVKWAWPIWMYVSVTGVLVYWMLYH